MTDFNGLFNVDAGETDTSVSSDYDNSLSSSFLSNIPEQDREVVGKYVKDWDAGVTKRFGEIHQQYEPYKELGSDPGQLSLALQLMQLAEENPRELLELLQQYVEDDTVETNDPIAELTEGINRLSQAPVGGDPSGNADPFSEQLSVMAENQKLMSNLLLEQQQERQAQAERVAIDNMLNALHTKHGSFDDDYVLLQIQRGNDPEAAVAKFNEFAENLVSSRTKKPAVPVLPGSGGGTPIGQVDKDALKDSKSRVAYISGLLAANAQANQ